ncbi:NTF2-like protein [Paraphaeosphaeria sporulosa]|uniref:NTF2-like protein n=1 Tax=Paraphaeosphaeria sporulosa TaxID=1460663 RepID=A0A177CCP3_9PLEO|nr:NTF2-like protein [Paraphaeosphaeria sporulosa]OAG04480.1 NTF2-like protein [Paraphaeosphaeria sporulosa]
MARPSNLEIVQNLYLANDNADSEAFYRDLSPTITWKESDGFPTPGVFRSRADIDRHVFNVLRQEWDGFRFSLEYLVDGNERIVAVGTYRGTHRKTGRSFEARASHVWHLLDGKIESFEQFADTYTMQIAALSPVDSVSVA